MARDVTLRLWKNSGYALGVVLTAICRSRSKTEKNTAGAAESELNILFAMTIRSVWPGAVTLTLKIIQYIMAIGFYRAQELVVIKTASTQNT